MTTCPVCGEDSSAEARFCSQCGARLDGTVATAVGPSDRVFSNLRGEERLVTVVFADMSESVRRTSGLDAEGAIGLVNPLLETMVELMTRYGGRIDRFLGDGILAVFGVPAAHEDDPIRAVWAALELRERASELGLPVTVGVNTGRVYFGPVGSSIHEELTVMGPTVNLAARFQSAAAAGEVIIGTDTEAQARAAFSLTPVTLTVKGMAEPVEAFKAERLLDHPDKVRGIEDLKTGLVGREAELDRLIDAYSDRRPLALVGVAGVGKSRLASELREVVSSGGGEWLEGRCLEISQASPYAPFQDLFLRHLSKTEPLTALGDSLEAMTDAGAISAARVADIAPFLAYLLGTPWGDQRDTAVTEADPELRHSLTVDAVVTYLTARSMLRPGVVFVDDIHWADRASLEITSRLGAAETDLMVLVTSRPPAGPSPETIDASFDALALNELGRDDSRVLITRLLDVSGIPGSLEEQILDHARGNPFYVEELIRSLIQRGLIARQNGGWRMTSEDVVLEVPPSVEGVLMARFDRLPLATRRAAKAAAVLGMTLDEPLFISLTGAELGEELANLVGAGILETAGADGYSFVHALTREAIYKSLLPSQRAELHERAAVSLETLRPSAVEQIAHHYENSRNDHKAVEYLCRAGEHALDAFTTDAARDHLTRGLDRVESLPESERPAWRGRLHARLGELMVRLAQHESAQASLRIALAEMDPEPLERARVWRLLGQSHRLQHDMEEAHRAYDEAEEALAGVGDDPVAKRAWIDVQRDRALALYFGGRGGEVAAHSERIEPVVEEHGTPAQQSDFLIGRVLHSFVETRFVVPESTVDLARRAADLAESGADPGRAAETRFVLGFTLLWADRTEEAADVLAMATELTDRVGNMTENCRAWAYRAVALRRLGLVDEAEDAAAKALESARALGDPYYTGHARAVQCWVEYKRATGACDRLAAEAYESWGWGERDGDRGLDCEFAWMAVWPRAADAYRRGEVATAVDHLRLLQVPWERPMPPDLRSKLDETVATADGDRLVDLFQGAERLRFL